jgi:hypothetical protein
VSALVPCASLFLNVSDTVSLADGDGSGLVSQTGDSSIPAAHTGQLVHEDYYAYDVDATEDGGVHGDMPAAISAHVDAPSNTDSRGGTSTAAAPQPQAASTPWMVGADLEALVAALRLPPAPLLTPHITTPLSAAGHDDPISSCPMSANQIYVLIGACYALI